MFKITQVIVVDVIIVMKNKMAAYKGMILSTIQVIIVNTMYVLVFYPTIKGSICSYDEPLLLYWTVLF